MLKFLLLPKKTLNTRVSIEPPIFFLFKRNYFEITVNFEITDNLKKTVIQKTVILK